MKRVLIILISLFVLVACQAPVSTQNVDLEVSVLHKSNQALLVDINEHGLAWISSTEEFEVGDVLKVTFDGVIMESYPVQLGKIYAIVKIDHDEHPILLYSKIIDILIEENTKESEIAINLITLDTAKYDLMYYLNETKSTIEFYEVDSWSALEALDKLSTNADGLYYPNGYYLEISQLNDQQLTTILQRSASTLVENKFNVQKPDGRYELEKVE